MQTQSRPTPIRAVKVGSAVASADDLDHLVKEDRIHGSLYTDPAIFDLEMKRIFGATWVYVGHESLMPKPGDFLTAQVGRQPVIIARDSEGALHGLYNRCTHRGVLVCREESGNAARFVCPYHGWSYNSDGKRAGIPYPAAYTEEFLRSDERGLVHVAALDTYGGFIFACLSPPKPPGRRRVRRHRTAHVRLRALLHQYFAQPESAQWADL